jgi:hypothetical protein
VKRPSKRDKEQFKYIICYLAWAVQNPDKHSGVVIMLKSRKQGTGKSTLGKVACPSRSRVRIDEVIDWDELGISDECLPLARGAAIASRYLLRQAHHHGGGAPAAGTRMVTSFGPCMAQYFWSFRGSVTRPFGLLIGMTGGYRPTSWFSVSGQHQCLPGATLRQCDSLCIAALTSRRMDYGGTARPRRTWRARFRSPGSVASTKPLPQTVRNRKVICARYANATRQFPTSAGEQGKKVARPRALQKFTLSPTTVHVLPPASEKVKR